MAPQTDLAETLKQALRKKAEDTYRSPVLFSINEVLAVIMPLLLQREQGWQPIETAPKDGTTVIGFDLSREYEPEEGLGAVEFMRFIDGAWLDPCTHTMKPSHWMPLPSAPKGEGQ